MFDRIHRSWALLRESWAVLREDRGLVVFPILSGICSLVVTLGFVIPVVIAIVALNHGSPAPGQYAPSGERFHQGPLEYAGLFLYYLITYFVIVFFNTGLVACVRGRFAGNAVTVQDGLRFALENIGRIFMWALVSATVGTVLKLIQERVGWLGRIAVSLVGIAWTLATMFVVPVLVYEQVGPLEALKRSAAAFKRTWGEAVIANFGMGTAFGLLALIGVVPLVGGIAIGIALMGTSAALAGIVMIGAFLLCMAYWIALAIVQSALQGIFLTACYEYSRTGVVPGVFTSEYVIGAWKPKGA